MENYRLKRLTNSFRYAINGIWIYFKSGGNVFIHISCSIVVIICAYLFNISLIEWCLVVLCIGGVLAAEAFNTAIEKFVDLVSPDYNKIAGLVKDISAGAVLIISISSLVIGLIIFLPKILP